MSLLGEWRWWQSVMTDPDHSNWYTPDLSGNGYNLDWDAGSAQSTDTVDGQCAGLTVNTTTFSTPAGTQWCPVALTIVARLAFRNSTDRHPGICGFGPGAGEFDKWVFHYDWDVGKTSFHSNEPGNGAGFMARGNAWTPTVDTMYSLACTVSGTTVTFYRDGAPDGSDSIAPIGMPNASSRVMTVGGAVEEGFFQSTPALVGVAFWDSVESTSTIYAKMAAFETIVGCGSNHRRHRNTAWVDQMFACA